MSLLTFDRALLRDCLPPLPVDVVRKVFALLDARLLGRVGGVSRAWWMLSREDALWNEMVVEGTMEGGGRGGLRGYLRRVIASLRPLCLVVHGEVANQPGELVARTGDVVRLVEWGAQGDMALFEAGGHVGLLMKTQVTHASKKYVLRDCASPDGEFRLTKGEIVTGFDPVNGWTRVFRDGVTYGVPAGCLKPVARAIARCDFANEEISFRKGERMVMVEASSLHLDQYKVVVRGREGVVPAVNLYLPTPVFVARTHLSKGPESLDVLEGDMVDVLETYSREALCERDHRTVGLVDRNCLGEHAPWVWYEERAVLVASVLKKYMLPVDPFDRLVDGDSDLALVGPFLRDYDLPRWYDVCKAVTFRSAVIPLSRWDRKVLQDLYNVVGNAGHKATIGRLAASISQGLALLRSDSFFVRTSSRSPKDAVLESRAYKMLLRKYLPAQAGDLNADGLAFYRAASEAMRLRKPEEAVELLSKSTRVWVDIKVGALPLFPTLCLLSAIEIPGDGFASLNHLPRLCSHSTASRVARVCCSWPRDVCLAVH